MALVEKLNKTNRNLITSQKTVIGYLRKLFAPTTPDKNIVNHNKNCVFGNCVTKMFPGVGSPVITICTVPN